MEIDKICRLCLKKEDISHDIFESDGRTTTSFKIMTVIGIEVNQFDKLPKQICTECKYNLEKSYLFRKLSKKYDSKLKKFVRKKALIPLEEISDDEEEDREEIEKCLSFVQNHELKKIEKFKEANLEKNKDMVFINIIPVSEGEKAQEQIKLVVENEGKNLEIKDEKKPPKISRKRRKSPKLEKIQKVDGKEALILNRSVFRKSSQDSKNLEINLVIDNEEKNQERKKPPKILRIRGKSPKLEKTQVSDKKEAFILNPSISVKTPQVLENSQINLVIDDKVEIKDRKKPQKIQRKSDKSPKLEKPHIMVENEAVILNPSVSEDSTEIEINLTSSQIKDNVIMKVHCANTNQHKCKECGTVLNSKEALNNHVQNHRKNKGFFCRHCPKWFPTQSTKDRHEAVHTGERPFSCNICNKSFSQNAILKRHSLIHLNIKPFPCQECDKVFSEKYLLEQHTNRQHLEVVILDVFQCTECPKTFSHRSGLSRHLMTHKGKTFTCTDCDRSFNDRSSLKRHVKTMHNEKK